MASDKDQIIDYMLTQDGMPGRDPAFPNAPVGWSRAVAEAGAEAAGLSLGEEHWEVVRVLQGAYKEDPDPKDPSHRGASSLASSLRPAAPTKASAASVDRTAIRGS